MEAGDGARRGENGQWDSEQEVGNSCLDQTPVVTLQTSILSFQHFSFSNPRLFYCSNAPHYFSTSYPF